MRTLAALALVAVVHFAEPTPTPIVVTEPVIIEPMMEVWPELPPDFFNPWLNGGK